MEKRMQRWQDSDLTEFGQYNARALGERLKDFELNQPEQADRRDRKTY